MAAGFNDLIRTVQELILCLFEHNVNASGTFSTFASGTFSIAGAFQKLFERGTRGLCTELLTDLVYATSGCESTWPLVAIAADGMVTADVNSTLAGRGCAEGLDSSLKVVNGARTCQAGATRHHKDFVFSSFWDRIR